MGSRHQARVAALSYLYQLDVVPETTTRLPKSFCTHFEVKPAFQGYFQDLVDGVCLQRDELDSEISESAENWRLSRMEAIDRGILRMGAWELLRGVEMSPAVVIDEAVELAKTYGSAESASFVNGILDRIAKKHGLGSNRVSDLQATS